MTNKQAVKAANPKARLDFYESLKGANLPCWFIRDGFQGQPYTEISKSPKDAWKQAADSLRASLAGRDA